MQTFREWLNEKDLNESIKTKEKFNYLSLNDKPSGTNGVFIGLEQGDLYFGIGIHWGPEFSAYIMPNAASDWRRISETDIEILVKYFGKKLGNNINVSNAGKLEAFKDAKELLNFFKNNVNGYEKLMDDLLFHNRTTLPTSLTELILKDVKLSTFEKRFNAANTFDKIQLLIKKYQPTIPEKGIIDLGVGYIKIDKYYWHIIGQLEDEKLKMLIGRSGKIYLELWNQIGIKTAADIKNVLEKSNILPPKTQKLFNDWIVNQMK